MREKGKGDGFGLVVDGGDSPHGYLSCDPRQEGHATHPRERAGATPTTPP